MIDKGSCNKGSISNPIDCECECNKSCDVGEYLNYESCKCRKKLVDKLFEEFIENNDEMNIAKITLAEHENNYEILCKCSCTLCIGLFSIIFTINIGIGTFFVYCKYMNHDKKTVAKEGSIFQAIIC